MAGRFWMCHWRNRSWRPDVNAEGAPINHSAGNSFSSRGISDGDVVYVVTPTDGQLFLGGKMTVDRIVGHDEAVRLFDETIYQADEHLIGVSGSGTPLNLHRCLSPLIARRLRYQSSTGPKPLFFISETKIGNQATRNVLEWTQETAQFLDNVIAVTDRLALSDQVLVVTDELLASGGISTAARALPEEIPSNGTYREGSAQQVLVNRYERDPRARAACILAHGSHCSACGMTFLSVYGPQADGYIHVHHLRPLSELGDAYQIDPVADLRPICPNCHAVAHLRIPPYSIEEIRAFLAREHGVSNHFHSPADAVISVV